MHQLSSSFILLMTLFSCNKEELEIPDKHSHTSHQKFSLTGQVLHHDRPVDTAWVYLKKDNTEFPGTDVRLYDYATPVFSDQAYYVFRSLPAGQYFIYAVGYDLGISDSVYGGIPLSVGGTDSIMEVNVPVTE